MNFGSRDHDDIIDSISESRRHAVASAVISAGHRLRRAYKTAAASFVTLLLSAAAVVLGHGSKAIALSSLQSAVATVPYWMVWLFGGAAAASVFLTRSMALFAFRSEADRKILRITVSTDRARDITAGAAAAAVWVVLALAFRR